MSLSDPQSFYRMAGKVVPWLMGIALVLFVVGFYMGFFVCPIDAKQGNSYPYHLYSRIGGMAFDAPIRVDGCV